jgi:uncharacterized protein (DUF433 family)
VAERARSGGAGDGGKVAQVKFGRSFSLKDEDLLARIIFDPKVMVGKPVIKGTRLTVDYVLNLTAHGSTAAEITQEYAGLTEEDVHACFLFATRALEDASFVPLEMEPA